MSDLLTPIRRNNAGIHISIVGGSVGGLAAAIELKDQLGASVAIYERSAGLMQARGAGVVMQPEVDNLLTRIGVFTPSVCVRLEERVSLTSSGDIYRQQAPQLMTAWDTLYKTMRTSLEGECYRQDSRLVAIQETEELVGIEFADGYRASADFLVGADGVNSTSRALLGDQNAVAEYAGYVAWRGLEDERDLCPSLVRQLEGAFTSFQSPGMQMLCYLVPGDDLQTGEGRRRVNWVWYQNVEAADLKGFMTGKDGKVYRSFLPPDQASPETIEAVLSSAELMLPKLFRDLVNASTLFMQPVQDVLPQPRLFGRSALLGDAAGTVRPHTAAGTSKAFGDARALATALKGWSHQLDLPTDALIEWELNRSNDLVNTATRGMRLAAHSQLGFGL